jgi:Ca2+-binding EF-hand superfamily protein
MTQPPGAYPSNYPGDYPRNYPGGYPSNYPGGYPGNYPSSYAPLTTGPNPSPGPQPVQYLSSQSGQYVSPQYPPPQSAQYPPQYSTSQGPSSLPVQGGQYPPRPPLQSGPYPPPQYSVQSPTQSSAQYVSTPKVPTPTYSSPGQTFMPNIPSAPSGSSVSSLSQSAVSSAIQSPSQTIPNRQSNVWYSQYYNQLSPQELQELQQWFTAVDKNRSGKITARELQSVRFSTRVLTHDSAVALLRAFDVDGDGALDFYEYASLHKFVMTLCTIYTKADVDKSRRLDIREMTQALALEGFGFSQQLVEKIVQHVVPSYKTAALSLDFHMFLKVSAYLALIRTAFSKRDTTSTGSITINLEQLVEIITDVIL